MIDLIRKRAVSKDNRMTEDPVMENKPVDDIRESKKRKERMGRVQIKNIFYLPEIVTIIPRGDKFKRVTADNFLKYDEWSGMFGESLHRRRI